MQTGKLFRAALKRRIEKEFGESSVFYVQPIYGNDTIEPTLTISIDVHGNFGRYNFGGYARAVAYNLINFIERVAKVDEKYTYVIYHSEHRWEIIAMQPGASTSKFSFIPLNPENAPAILATWVYNSTCAEIKNVQEVEARKIQREIDALQEKLQKVNDEANIASNKAAAGYDDIETAAKRAFTK